jgi:hypothetical protein
MAETIPTCPFDDMEALAWLRSQPDGRATASAAELGRQWGWNRMRTGRRLKAWQEAGHIRRNAEAIVFTTPVTPAVTEVAGVTAIPRTTGARRSMTPVKLAAFIVALMLACVSAVFSIDGLTAIFAGAFWPVIAMGAALEGCKARRSGMADRALARGATTPAPGARRDDRRVDEPERGRRVRLPYARHIDHMAAIDLALADRTADAEARLAIQGQTVADLDRCIAQIDAAIEESTRLGRPTSAMTIADQKRHDRADIVAARQREAQALASLQIEKAKIDVQRRRAEADVGPVRYLAELIGTPATDLERPVRLLTLALVAVLDPMAVALLLAVGAYTTRAGSR